MKSILVIVSLLSMLNLKGHSEEVLPMPKSIVLEKHVSLEDKSSEILAARRYAAFWNSGDPKYAEEALDAHFMDRTLPQGREQGIVGALAASKGFRAAVPNLTAEVVKMVVADDHVSVHLNFEGNFTGTFNGVQGKGQKINFIATDVYQIKNGKITDNWHIEDNLTLLKQMNLIN